MADNLPLLFFPSAKNIIPRKEKPRFGRPPHFPAHDIQAHRLSNKLKGLVETSGSMAGLDPEMVLVIEIVGDVKDFKNAIDRTDELEWLGEWDIDDIEADDHFYQLPSEVEIGVNFFKGKIDGITTKEQSTQIRKNLIGCGFINSKGKIIGDDLLIDIEHRNEIITVIQDKEEYLKKSAKEKILKGRLFLSFSNERGMQKLLSLFERWTKDKNSLPRGQTSWRDVFNQIKDIRRWGIKETLYETGMIERWQDDIINNPSDEDTIFQVDLFYHKDEKQRRKNENTLKQLLQYQGGEIIATIDKKEIAFHAVKAKLPTNKIRHLLGNLDSSNTTDIQLFNFSGIMYFRPTGQNISSSDDEQNNEHAEFEELPTSDLPSVVAILDGVPNIQHQALKNHLLIDDPDNLSATYQAGKRKHGTAMASLVIHGDLSSRTTLSSNVYHLPVMQLKPNIDSHPNNEGFPNDVFLEDRIERAVRRIFEGEGNTPAQAPDVKIINISLGDPDRPFIHFPSPWARLLDWLSYKYNVLFCVSAGNYEGNFDVEISNSEFSSLSNDDKHKHIIKCISRQLSQRRLLSPAESLNAVTVGALNTDESSNFQLGNRVDLLPDKLFSPISRFGLGFKKSIKPEIYFAGGKQLYAKPYTDNETSYRINKNNQIPGQQVASDSLQQGELSAVKYTCGTSNATALATHNGARIYETLSALQADNDANIPNDLMAVLIKTLLVHGAKQDDENKRLLTEALKNNKNSRTFKNIISRYLGYGAVDIERVLACTEQRGTVLGSGKIKENKVHEYIFPIPEGLSDKKVWRRMTITLAWFSPINTNHRNLREAKLSFNPPNNGVLKINREDSDHNTVKKGTVQHEVLEGENQISVFQDNEVIKLHISCKKDATEKLDEEIHYGLALTLEVGEGIDISIYNQIKNRIQPTIQI